MVENKSVGVLRGTFKLILRHHVELIQKCSQIVDKLYILFDSNELIEEKGKIPILNEFDKRFILEAINGVARAEMFCDEEDFLHRLELIKKENSYTKTFLYIKGGDYAPNVLDIPEIVDVRDREFITVAVEKSDPSESTSDLCQRIVKLYSQTTKRVESIDKNDF